MIRSGHNSTRFQKGFTLVEVVITCFLFSLLIAGTAAMFKEIFSGSTQKGISLATADQTRLVASQFSNELRNAAYGNDGSFPINQASPTQLIFFTNYSATSTNANRVRYYVSGSTLYKGVTVPGGIPLFYGSEQISAVQSNLAATSSLFSYYDGTYAGTSSPMSQPVNVTQVKFIQINLSVLMESQRNATTTFSFSSGATVRNLKNNLGN